MRRKRCAMAPYIQAGRFDEQLSSDWHILIHRLVYALFNRLGISMLKFHRRFIAVSLVVFAGFLLLTAAFTRRRTTACCSNLKSNAG